MEYVHLYESSDGESHFEDVPIEVHPVEFIPGKPLVDLSGRHGATDMVFVRMPAGWFGDSHPTPRKQFFMVMDGQMEITASDGETRRFKPGVVVLLDDAMGKGHVTRNVGPAELIAVLVWCA